MVVTTRIRSLLSGAEEVQCETLSLEASLELLLRAGGCEELIKEPPPAAVEAVELCGRLPLALDIAGGIIVEMADTWQVQRSSESFQALQAEPIPERVLKCYITRM